jgi:hypothetical protein
MLFGLKRGKMKPHPIRAVAQRFAAALRQEQALGIESESSTTLTLRGGRVVTVFDRLSRAVTQRGRQIATFGTIQHVHIQEESASDGPASWVVSLQLSGSRVVPVGRTTDRTSASTVAAHVATITGTNVVG